MSEEASRALHYAQCAKRALLVVWNKIEWRDGRKPVEVGVALPGFSIDNLRWWGR